METDFADVRGQRAARRALEVAAAGGHSALLIGSPGSGRTMLARRLPGILPQLEESERESVDRVARDAGLAPPSGRPFRAPHHTVSAAGMVGRGGWPGEVALAQGGVLFLDEVTEFSRLVMGAIFRKPRGPLLVAAMHPCPCGYCGSLARSCRCPDTSIAAHRARAKRYSGSFDLCVTLDSDLGDQVSGETTAAMQARVVAARERPMPHCADFACGDKTLAVARTIARLEGAPCVQTHHVEEALGYQFPY